MITIYCGLVCNGGGAIVREETGTGISDCDKLWQATLHDRNKSALLKGPAGVDA